MNGAPKNNNEYLNYLIEKYADTVYRIALTRTNSRYDSEDIFQEVFLRLAKKMPTFENEEHEKAWIIRVTINCSNTLLTSNWKRKTQELDENIEFQTKERHDIYYEVAKLPVKYRTVIYLFYYEGYKINEISKILNINESTIKTQLTRAREKLKESMKIGGIFEDE